MTSEWLRTDISRNNNFDLIRLLAAIQVAVLHTMHHMVLPVNPAIEHFLTFFSGVPIFFFISGLLVTYSLSNCNTVYSFYKRRVYRVFPGLWAAFGAAILVLLFFSQITMRELRLPTFWFWAFGQLTIFQFFNPPFFRNFATGVVNGSLWTISVEIGFYLALPWFVWGVAKWVKGRTQRRKVLAIVAVAGILLSYILYAFVATFNYSGPTAIKLLNETAFPHFWLFGLGMLAYLYYEPLKWLTRGRAWVLFLCYVTFCYTLDLLHLSTFSPAVFVGRVILCAVIFAAGFHEKHIAGKVLRGWDLSYGLYLFHMLAVNAAIAQGATGSWAAATLALCASVLAASISWRFVERPSLMKGKTGPHLKLTARRKTEGSYQLAN